MRLIVSSFGSVRNKVTIAKVYPVKCLRVLGGGFYPMGDRMGDGSIEDRSKKAKTDVIRVEERVEYGKPELVHLTLFVFLLHQIPLNAAVATIRANRKKGKYTRYRGLKRKQSIFNLVYQLTI